MHIKRLELENFRGSRNLVLDLHKQLNLFVGLNGAGKSTVLDAAAILLSWAANRIKRPGASGRPIPEVDIRNDFPLARLKLCLEMQNREYEWQVGKARKGYMERELSSLAEASEFAAQIWSDSAGFGGEVSIPLFAYYPVNRAVLDIPLRIRRKHRFDLVSAYDESLISGANFRTFFEWFREREDLENEARRDRDMFDHLSLFSRESSKDFNSALTKEQRTQFPDPQLEAVRKALIRLMPEFRNLTVRRNPLRMEVEKGGQLLSVEQLSDGEKCLMAMVGDMARRMAIANPALDNPLEGEGVFLIDKIDMHLHPSWQRMVVPGLLEVFPNCQFMISTHSPHVVTHVQPDSLFLLKMGDSGLEYLPTSESYGKTVESVLEDLMGLETTRPDKVQRDIKKIYELIDADELDGATSEAKSLAEIIGRDPELVKIEILIRRKELIGK